MKIICIGRNYTDHIRELDDTMGPAAVMKDSGDPIFFCKPDTALLRNNEPFYIPAFSNELHYETELVVKINRVAKSIPLEFAHRCYSEVGLGIDFTARDIQRRCVAEGLPWEICKAFDHSAAIPPEFLHLDSLGKGIGELTFEMSLSGDIRQRGDTSRMIFTVDRIISYISQFMTLKIGDLLFTGTPAGVGPVTPGDRIAASLEGRKLLDFEIK